MLISLKITSLKRKILPMSRLHKKKKKKNHKTKTKPLPNHQINLNKYFYLKILFFPSKVTTLTE